MEHIADGKNRHHHAGVHQNERAHPQERHGIGQVGEHDFEQFKEVLQDELPPLFRLPVRVSRRQAAEGLPQKDQQEREHDKRQYVGDADQVQADELAAQPSHQGGVEHKPRDAVGAEEAAFIIPAAQA